MILKSDFIEAINMQDVLKKVPTSHAQAPGAFIFTSIIYKNKIFNKH